MIALEVRSNSTTCMLLSVFYRPLDADVSLLTKFRDFANKYSRTGLSNLVVTSDFNYPNIDWNLGCPVVSNPDTEEFCNILDDFFLIQKNLYATHDSSSRGNILDIVLTNNDFLVEDVLVRPNAFDSNHHPLTFKLHAEKSRPNYIQWKFHCYTKG